MCKKECPVPDPQPSSVRATITSGTTPSASGRSAGFVGSSAIERVNAPTGPRLSASAAASASVGAPVRGSAAADSDEELTSMIGDSFD